MKSEKPTPIFGDLLEDDEELSLQELCSACELSESQVVEMVEHGVIDPVGGEPAEWRFVAVSMQRVRITRNLQRDHHHLWRLRVRRRGQVWRLLCCR